jgi:hypothetical protein
MSRGTRESFQELDARVLRNRGSISLDSFSGPFSDHQSLVNWTMPSGLLEIEPLISARIRPQRQGSRMKTCAQLKLSPTREELECPT